MHHLTVWFLGGYLGLLAAGLLLFVLAVLARLILNHLGAPHARGIWGHHREHRLGPPVPDSRDSMRNFRNSNRP